jgi:hypothetical protein
MPVYPGALSVTSFFPVKRKYDHKSLLQNPIWRKAESTGNRQKYSEKLGSAAVRFSRQTKVLQ